jgi:hypothetical protein
MYLLTTIGRNLRVTSVAIVTILVTACGDSERLGPPTAPTPPVVTTPAPPPPITVHLSGLVHENGIPIAGARVAVRPQNAGGWSPTVLSTLTDGRGFYEMSFESAPQPTHGAEAQVEKEGFEPNDQYITPAAEVLKSLRLRRITPITAGDSITLVIAPDDSLCGLDLESLCRTVRVVARIDGMLTLEVTAENPSLRPALDLGEATWPYRSARSIRVSAGGEVRARVLGMPWDAQAAESFRLITSLSR